jgi:AP-3 complex subunit delta
VKYVGLLAFTKIVETHAHLVAEHQDVIMECIDDPDISIRLRALDLSVGMVNSDNLQQVVGKLIRQLKPVNEAIDPLTLDPYTAVEEEDMEEGLHPRSQPSRPQVEQIVLPESYKVGVIRKILEMCSRDMYTNISDFEWYLDVLVQLVRYCPPVGMREGNPDDYDEEDEEEEPRNTDVGEEIGYELKNVAVRVKDLREEAVRAAALLVERKDGMFPSAGGGGRRVLGAAGWIVGEYARYVTPGVDLENRVLTMLQLVGKPLRNYHRTLKRFFPNITRRHSCHLYPSHPESLRRLSRNSIRRLDPRTPHNHHPPN